jgi:hypothetical protein
MRSFVVLAFALTANGISAQTISQKSALDVLVGAAWFTEKCTLLRVNEQPYEALMTAHGIDERDLSGNGRFSGYVKEARLEVLEKMEGVGVKEICALGFAFYGPKGIGTANILTYND